MTQFENMDLRGYFPASLMNMIISQYTVDSLQGFYEVLQEIEKEWITFLNQNKILLL